MIHAYDQILTKLKEQYLLALSERDKLQAANALNEETINNLSAELGAQYDRIAKRDKTIDDLINNLDSKTRDYDKLNQDHEELKTLYVSLCKKHDLALKEIASHADELGEQFETASEIYLDQQDEIATLKAQLQESNAKQLEITKLANTLQCKILGLQAALRAAQK